MIRPQIERLVGLRRAMGRLSIFEPDLTSGRLGPFPPPGDQTLRDAERKLWLTLPRDYVDLLRSLPDGLPPQFSIYWVGGPADIVGANDRMRQPFGEPSSYRGRGLPPELVAFADDEALDVFAFDITQARSDGNYPIVAWRQATMVERLFPTFADYLAAEVERLDRYRVELVTSCANLAGVEFRSIVEDMEAFARELPMSRPVTVRAAQSREIVRAAYAKKGLFDPVVDHVLAEDALVDRAVSLVSAALVRAGDVTRLNGLWEGVIAQRCSVHQGRPAHNPTPPQGAQTKSAPPARSDTTELAAVRWALSAFADALDGCGDAAAARAVRDRALAYGSAATE